MVQIRLIIIRRNFLLTIAGQLEEQLTKKRLKIVLSAYKLYQRYHLSRSRHQKENKQRQYLKYLKNIQLHPDCLPLPQHLHKNLGFSQVMVIVNSGVTLKTISMISIIMMLKPMRLEQEPVMLSVIFWKICYLKVHLQFWL